MAKAKVEIPKEKLDLYDENAVYQFKITLFGAHPLIWRRFPERLADPLMWRS
jgi:hypothetical protein